MTTASAGKNMYIFFAAASAVPIYAVLNEPTSVSPDSRANVFVRHVQRYKITIWSWNTPVRRRHRRETVRQDRIQDVWRRRTANDS